MSINVDLTTLSGWNELSEGTHSITMKAKATGYNDSSATSAVSVVKLMNLANTIWEYVAEDTTAEPPSAVSTLSCGGSVKKPDGTTFQFVSIKYDSDDLCFIDSNEIELKLIHSSSLGNTVYKGSDTGTYRITFGSSSFSNATVQSWLTSYATRLIQFEVGIDTYVCQSGMTWAQFVASNYNTDSFTIDNNNIRRYGFIIRLSNTNILKTDTIINGAEYEAIDDSVPNVFLEPMTDSELPGTHWKFMINQGDLLGVSFNYDDVSVCLCDETTFETSEQSYSGISTDAATGTLYYEELEVWDGGWVEEEYQTIYIEDCTPLDSSSTELLDFLNEYAVCIDLEIPMPVEQEL